jgi:hypothetical protein
MLGAIPFEELRLENARLRDEVYIYFQLIVAPKITVASN